MSFIFVCSFSSIGPVADLMSASSSYLDKSSCYNSQVYGQNYSSHCYYGNMEYLSSGVSHSSLNVPAVSSCGCRLFYVINFVLLSSADDLATNGQPECSALISPNLDLTKAHFSCDVTFLLLGRLPRLF